MDKILSIIVPVYNVEKYLRKCLDSIFDQTIDNFEVICVNDGSTDSSADILDEYSRMYENLIVLTQKNAGVSVARNSAMKVATGKYIGFVDSDDFIDKNMYLAMIQRAEKCNADIVIANPYIYDMSSDNTYVYRNMLDYLRLDRLNGFSPLDVPKVFEYIGPWDKIYNAEFLRKTNVEFPVGRIFEDHVFSYYTFALAQRVSVIKESYYYYRKNAGGSITDKERVNDNYKYDFLRNSKEIKEFLKEHNCYKQVAPVFLEYFMRMGMYHHAYATTKKAFNRIFDEMSALLDSYELDIIKNIGIEKFIWYSRMLAEKDKKRVYKNIKSKQQAPEVKVEKI